ncbi:MAG: TolC family protein [Gemmatimonadetes bacterium]|nr:TolC family protein [Gemmatimonadota bacterium]
MKNILSISRRAATTVGLALAMTAATAAAQQDTRQITFDEAVSIARQQSTALDRARNQVSLAELSVSDAKMQFVPSLQLSTGGSQDFGRTFSTDEGQILDGNNQSLSARISSSVTLFDGFGNVANLREAQYQMSAAELDGQRAEQTVLFSVISGYISLIEAREQVSVAEENLAFQEAREGEIQVLVDGGTRAIADLYQQQAQVASARVTLVDARRAAALSEVDLVQVLRLDPADSYDFVAPPIPDVIEGGDDPDVENLLTRAFDNRLDLAGSEADRDAAQSAVRAAKASYWPSVSLAASYGSSYTSATPLSVASQFDSRQSGTLSLAVSIPLFDGLQSRRQTERARIQEYDAQLAVEDVRQEVALEVRRAALDREAAVERLSAAQAQVEAAGAALDAVRVRYDSGAATIFEVSQSQADYVSASSSLVSARYTLVFQDELLDYYVGELGPDAEIGQ